jgi:hypothetical protein
VYINLFTKYAIKRVNIIYTPPVILLNVKDFLSLIKIKICPIIDITKITKNNIVNIKK